MVGLLFSLALFQEGSQIFTVHLNHATIQQQPKPLPFPPQKGQPLGPQSSYSKVCQAPPVISAKLVQIVNSIIFVKFQLNHRQITLWTTNKREKSRESNYPNQLQYSLRCREMKVTTKHFNALPSFARNEITTKQKQSVF